MAQGLDLPAANAAGAADLVSAADAQGSGNDAEGAAKMVDIVGEEAVSVGGAEALSIPNEEVIAPDVPAVAATQPAMPSTQAAEWLLQSALVPLSADEGLHVAEEVEVPTHAAADDDHQAVSSLYEAAEPDITDQITDELLQTGSPLLSSTMPSSAELECSLLAEATDYTNEVPSDFEPQIARSEDCTPSASSKRGDSLLYRKVMQNLAAGPEFAGPGRLDMPVVLGEPADEFTDVHVVEQPASASGYPADAARYFGEHGAHRLRWAHAVNNKRRLRAALATNAHFLEADVSSGPLVVREDPPAKGQGQKAGSGGIETSVKTESGQSVIMAHYPTELSSDLSFESFIEQVLRHNERVVFEAVEHEITAAACSRSPVGHERSPGASQRSPASRSGAHEQLGAARFSSQGEEAAVFCRELDSELEQAAAQSSTLASCVGSRRDATPGRSFVQVSLKGIKLDFKRADCVGPCIDYLRSIDAARKLGGHLWLNADVFAGPGALLTPFDAKQFVRLCAENLPEAVLSLSWGSSMLSTMKSYSAEMVEHMIELCMTPIVPREWPSLRDGYNDSPVTAERSAKRVIGDGEMCLTPAAVCRHITFAVAVEYAQMSARGLSKLLDSVPGTSLTLFSGYGSVGISPLHVKELLNSYGTTRLFLDLKLSKAWRTCGVGGRGSCCVQ